MFNTRSTPEVEITEGSNNHDFSLVPACHRQCTGFCRRGSCDAFLSLLWALFLSCSAVAQSPHEQRQPADDRPAGPVGVGKFEPGKWGVVSVQLVNPTDGVLFVASEPLQEVAFEFLSEPDPPRLEPAEFEHVVSEQIGYSIVSRSRVGTILGAFCLALTGAGVMLMRQGRLELIGWLGPAGVALASVVLLGVGRASREAVPKTVAVTQFAETSPDTNEIQVTGLAATYSADRSEDPLAAVRGGHFWPAMTGGGGTVLRMISSDRDQWSLQNLVLPAGQQLIPFAQSFRVEQPVTAVGTFGETGLTGTIRPGPFEQTADAVLALPSTRNLAVQLQEGGAFTAAAEGLLAPGEFLSATLLSDEQRRRVEIYQALFSPAKKDETPWPAEPVLLVWARPLDPGFQLLPDAAQAGSALVSIPLRLTSPPVGTRVRIPGPFLRYRAVGAETSGTFDERRRRWSGPFPTGLNTTLRFQLPPSVLPLRPESAVLSVDIQAPSRELQITGFTQGETVILDSRQSPLGRIEFRISREDVLQVNDTGELELGLNVGDARDDQSDRVLDPSEAQMWKIIDVQLELTGVTMAP